MTGLANNGDISGTGTWQGRTLSNFAVEWYRNSTTAGQDQLPAGVYTLAQLNPGLTIASFGNSTYGSANTSGAAFFANEAGSGSNASVIFPVVNGNWNVAGGGAWSTAANWDSNPQAPGVSGQPGDTAAFGNIIGSSSATIALDAPVVLGFPLRSATRRKAATS